MLSMSAAAMRASISRRGALTSSPASAICLTATRCTSSVTSFASTPSTTLPLLPAPSVFFVSFRSVGWSSSRVRGSIASTCIVEPSNVSFRAGFGVVGAAGAAAAAAAAGGGVTVRDALMTELTLGACTCAPFIVGVSNNSTALPLGLAQNSRPL